MLRKALISRLPRGGGQFAMVTRPLPSLMDLKSDCIKEIACPISIFCK